MIQTGFNGNEDLIDVRDVIARVENLDASIEYFEEDNEPGDPDEVSERNDLMALLNELKGYGGDEQWQGDWYPITLIRDSYFINYAQELADDIGAVNSDATWPNNCIDWERAARELQQDYSIVEFGGVTYWYR